MAFTQVHTDFLQNLYGPALDIEQRYGIPHEASLAQAAYESGWGRLFTGDYNYFGMTAYDGYTGKKTLSWTREEVPPSKLYLWPTRDASRDTKLANGNILIYVQRYFQSYDSVEQAFEAYAKNIVAVYPDSLGKKDPVQFLNALFDDVGKYKYATTDYRDQMPGMVATIRNLKAYMGDSLKKKSSSVVE